MEQHQLTSNNTMALELESTTASSCKNIMSWKNKDVKRTDRRSWKSRKGTALRKTANTETTSDIFLQPLEQQQQEGEKDNLSTLEKKKVHLEKQQLHLEEHEEGGFSGTITTNMQLSSPSQLLLKSNQNYFEIGESCCFKQERQLRRQQFESKNNNKIISDRNCSVKVRRKNASSSIKALLAISLLMKSTSFALLPTAEAAIFPEFLSYSTCVEAPPTFSGCMSNVTADIGERVVLTCQVNPRCIVRYLHWYHEPLDSEGNVVSDQGRRLLKKGKNSNEPYVHTIYKVNEYDFGRYVCVIENVMGKRECAAYLDRRNSAPKAGSNVSLFQFTTLLLSSMLLAHRIT